ncbi:MAG TPA: stage III sporulation protein AF [Clostridia bacterium]
MEEIKGWVFNIAAAAVLMVILDLLIPESRIRKFTRLLTGFIIMFIIINPAAEIIGNGKNGIFENLQGDKFLFNSQADRTVDANQREQAKQTLELYREILLSDIHNRLNTYKEIEKAEVDIVLNENINSEKYGQIRKVYINLIFSKAGKEGKLIPGANNETVSEIAKEIQRVFLLDEKDILINISEN